MISGHADRYKQVFASYLLKFWRLEMNTYKFGSAMRRFILIIAVAIAIAPAILAQTPIKLHSNKFAPADDVKLGHQAAGEVEQKMPLLRDPQLEAYVSRVGERLAAAIPQEFQHSEFQYSFKVVDAKEINAFALPGGPMYVNSGMIKAAKSEAEMAGVMAHEISHVALRHGTAQVTKAQKYSMLSNILGMGGAVVGGPLATVAQLGAQGVGVYLLKFSREYETEADLLGARIMADAGYDPRDLANMFRTIESQGGGGGGFLSDHPSAKDRYAKINQEAQALKINTNATPDSHDFIAAQQHLTGGARGGQMPGGNQAYSNPDSRAPNTGNHPTNSSISSGRIEAPSSRLKSVNKGSFNVSIPENWHEIEQQNGVWFAPSGAYGTANNQTVFTHAVNLGAVQTRAGDAQQATEEFINSLKQGSNLRARGGFRPVDVDGREGKLITFDNTNEATGQAEIVNILTTQLQNGDLFYMITVSPTDEYKNYQSTFLAILRSLRLND
jgi:predicted Zn-dependent protease